MLKIKLNKIKKGGHKLMRKIIAYLLAVSLVFCITTSNVLACSKNGSVTEKKEDTKYKTSHISYRTIKDLNNYMNTLEKNRNFHGSVLVEKDGRVILSKGYGMADYENGVKNTVNTRFPIGSMTKQIVAMAIMQLQEKGKLSVNDSLSKYIPDFPRGEEITLQQLLTHTSGIKGYYSNDMQLTDRIKALKERTPLNIINIIKEENLVNNPGEVWEYSNSGYLILGYIVEKVSGKTLEDYLTKNIFKPLKMFDTTASFRDGKRMYNAQGYMGFLENIKYDSEDYDFLNLAFGAGFITSTVEDMYKWSKAFDKCKIAKRKTIDEIFKGYANADGAGYGYGWFIEEGEFGREYSHAGVCEGFNSIISIKPDNKATVIVLTNKVPSGQNIDEIKNNIHSIIEGAKVDIPQEKKEISMDSAQLEKYTGVYEYVDFPDVKLVIEKADGMLIAQLTEQGQFTVYAQSETQFFTKIVEADLNFEMGDDSSINGVVINQSGQQLRFRKVN